MPNRIVQQITRRNNRITIALSVRLALALTAMNSYSQIAGSVSPAERSRVASAATSLFKQICNILVKAEAWVIEDAARGKLIKADHRRATLLFDRSGLFRSLWSGRIGERMRNGSARPAAARTDDFWFRKAEAVAKQAWPGVRTEREKVVFHGEERSLPAPRGWSSWSNTASVRLKTAVVNGTYRGISVIFCRGTGECLAINMSLPGPVKKKPWPPRKPE